MNIKENINKLLETDISSYEINRQTGVTRQLIDKYRKEPETIGKITLDNALALNKYWEELNMKTWKNEGNAIVDAELFDDVLIELMKRYKITEDIYTDTIDYSNDRMNAYVDFEDGFTFGELTLTYYDGQTEVYFEKSGKVELRNKIMNELESLDEEIRGSLYDVYEESNGNIWLVDSGMAYNGDDKEAKEIAQVEDGKVINWR